eukprot:12225316-Karenia_brevis.AAC.1
MERSNMVRFTKAKGRCGSLGVFCVVKKNGRLRLIFDTRVLNTKFVEPPKTKLPSAGAFGAVEVFQSEPLFLAAADVENAFYNLSVPHDLAEEFSLPTICARHLGITYLNGESVSGDEAILPLLQVLPMGWSWSLHFCQKIVEDAVSKVVGTENLIVDKTPSPCLDKSGNVAGAAYVDNFAVLGCSAQSVSNGLDKIVKELRSTGLPIHEISSAEERCEFLGLELHRVAADVCWKFCLGIALGLEWCGGSASPTTLWSSVRKELQMFSALLPLLFADTHRCWSQDVHASDASPYGLGVCHAQWSCSQVSQVGRQAENWRFRTEEAIAA